MKKSSKTFLALMLVSVIALMLPLTALATTLSGTYEGYSYTCNATGNASYIYTKLTYRISSKLEVQTFPDVYYTPTNGTLTHFGNNQLVGRMKTSATSVSKSYSFDDFGEDYLPDYSSGYFAACDYYYKIVTHTVAYWSTDFN